MSDAESSEQQPHVRTSVSHPKHGTRTGESEKRREDASILTGRAQFTDDHMPSNTHHLAFLRSETAHAEIQSIDSTAARSMDGVIGVFTWDDIESSSTPGLLPIVGLDPDIPAHPILAIDRVRYHGQPIAAVVADDRYLAQDAIEAMSVAYTQLEPVVDQMAAISRSAPQLYDTVPDNVAVTGELGDEQATKQAFAHADTAVEIQLTNNRLIPSALEPRAAIATFDPDDGFTVTMTSQSPHRHRRNLSHTLGVPEREIRVIAPRVGGGFGHKGHHHPGEAMAAWCARKLEVPVKWTATRQENYLEGAHGRDHQTTAKMALDADGTIRGIQVETFANVGAYGLGGGARMPARYGRLLSSQYAIESIHCKAHGVFTTTAPIHSYRGAGRPEAVYVTERLVDVAASELGIDPVAIRRRNLIAPDDFPYDTPVGSTYDSGTYESTMDMALDSIGYVEAVDTEEIESSDTGVIQGIGVANYVESTGGGFESGLVRVHPDGGVSVYAGTHSHGQGHETTYAQLVADVLELQIDEIRVSEGDTEAIPTGTGTFGSRSTIVGGNAVVESAQKVLANARRLAAAELDVDQTNIRYADGTFFVADGAGSISFAEVAQLAYGWGLPAQIEPGLEATTFYEVPGAAYTFGTHACIVSIDTDTGEVKINRYIAVDDCGNRVNPALIDGQIHGGVAQGIGQAMYEQVVYDDESGRLRTDTMDNYSLPRAMHIPDITTDHTITPSPLNELGVKGIGEAGTIAAPPAVVNAVCNALDVSHIDMPLTPERILNTLSKQENQ